MKKTARILAMLLAFFCITSCGTSDIPADETTVAVESERGTEAETEPILIEEGINADKINIERIEGLNEQIYIQLEKTTAMLEDFSAMDFKVSYRAMDEAEFTELDKELYLDEDEYVGCYILGLPKGQYCVKIECGEGDEYARTTILDIDVEKQDRSGYAHFNREEGIGGYNNDGSVKDNAVILYVNNENKNTVTLDIDGTTYTGLVQILQAKQYMEEPLIVRVTDKITTNQFKNKWTRPRMADDSNLTEGYFENTLTTKYGENLAGLQIRMYDGREGLLNVHLTTPDGYVLHETTEIGQRIGTDADGNLIYSDAVCTNCLYLVNANDVTIEGVGTKAEFYQFGLRLAFCNSFELRNMIISTFPWTALGFQSFELDSYYKHDVINGGYWIHNNTFYSGKNDWSLGVEKRGDETLDFCFIQDVTISYNIFSATYKGMLIGTYEEDECRDFTIHHNFYISVGQRLPLTRNTNIHSYNNVFGNSIGISVRETGSNFFSEQNWFNGGVAYYACDPNLIKSWNDVYAEGVSDTAAAVIVTAREQALEGNIASHDGVDYSTFDTNPELFYYDAENKCSDVDLLIEASTMNVWDAESWMRKYAGAGTNVRLDLSGGENSID